MTAPDSPLQPSASIASATSSIAESGIALAASSRTISRAPGTACAIASPFPTGKNRSWRPWTTRVGILISGEPLAPTRRGAQSSAARTPCPAGWPCGRRVPLSGRRGPKCVRRATGRRRGHRRGSLRRRRRSPPPTCARPTRASVARTVGSSWRRRGRGGRRRAARPDRASADQGERRERGWDARSRPPARPSRRRRSPRDARSRGSEARDKSDRGGEQGRAGVVAGLSGSAVVDSPLSRKVNACTPPPPAARRRQRRVEARRASSGHPRARRVKLRRRRRTRYPGRPRWR